MGDGLDRHNAHSTGGSQCHARVGRQHRVETAKNPVEFVVTASIHFWSL